MPPTAFRTLDAVTTERWALDDGEELKVGVSVKGIWPDDGKWYQGNLENETPSQESG